MLQQQHSIMFLFRSLIIFFDYYIIRHSERGVLLKGCNMKSRVCIRCFIMRTSNVDVEAVDGANDEETSSSSAPPAADTVPASSLTPAEATTAVVATVPAVTIASTAIALEASIVPAATAIHPKVAT